MTLSAELLNPRVCVAGGGPAGVVLSLLLARAGIPVTLLESHQDFDRQFRGDTLHASSLEILDQLGLADPVLALSHSRLGSFRMQSGDREITIADMGLLRTRFPFVALVPQVRFLDLLVDEAGKYPGFNVVMGATVTGLRSGEQGVHGLEFTHEGHPYQVSAEVVIGADGRQSTVREAASLELVRNAAPMDVLWFQLPRLPGQKSGEAAILRFGVGTMIVVIDRGDYWQVGFVILKGGYRDVRKAGFDSFKTELAQMLPELADSVAHLKDWSDCAILAVVTGRVKRWYQDGLLLIGDAAHVMSPVGGIGINYAINDAVAAANVLIPALTTGTVTTDHLAAVQKRREWPVQFIQAIQAMAQKRVISSALHSGKSFTPPLPLRIVARVKFLQGIAARIMAYGLRPERIATGAGPV